MSVSRGTILAPNGKPARQEMRNYYEATRYTTRRSYIPGAVQSARFDATKSTRTELQRLSRYHEKNNAIVNRLADIFEAYTVGSGLSLTLQSSDPEWNKAGQDWWEETAGMIDLTSRQGLGTLTGLMSRLWFVDGEAFALLTRGESGRPRVQLVESHMVQTPPDLSKLEGRSIVDGVKLDGNRRPSAYYIGEEDEKGRLAFGAPRPAEFVVHLFEPSRAAQYRGLPFTSCVLNELADLGDLQRLEMDAAKEHALVSRIIKTQSGEDEDEDAIRSTGETDDDGKTRYDYYKDEIGASTKILKWGDEFTQIASTRPSVVTKEYWRYLTECVCAGVGIPYVLAFPDGTVGGVEYRGVLDMANTFFKSRSAVVASVLRRIYIYAMGWARYNVPTLRDAPADWFKIGISCPRAVNVDVGRNSAAMLAELESGATNYDLIYGPLGLDWKVELRKKATHAKYIRDLATEFGVDPSEISTKQVDRPGRFETIEPEGEPLGKKEKEHDEAMV